MTSPSTDTFVTIDRMNGPSIRHIIYLMVMGPFKMGFYCFKLLVIEPYLTFLHYIWEIILAPAYFAADMLLLILGASQGRNNIAKPLNNLYKDHPLTPKNLKISKFNQNQPLLSSDYWLDSVSHLLNPDNMYSASQDTTFLSQFRKLHRIVNFILISMYLVYKFAFISFIFITIVSVSTVIPFIFLKLVFNSTNVRMLVKFILEAAKITVDEKLEDFKKSIDLPSDVTALNSEEKTLKLNAKVSDPIKSSLISNADEFDDDILLSRINTSIDALKDNKTYSYHDLEASKINNIDPLKLVIEPKSSELKRLQDESNTKKIPNENNTFGFEKDDLNVDLSLPKGIAESSSSRFGSYIIESQLLTKRKNSNKRHDSIKAIKPRIKNKKNSLKKGVNTKNFSVSTGGRTSVTTINSLFSAQNSMSDAGDTNNISQTDESMMTDSSLLNEKISKKSSS